MSEITQLPNTEQEPVTDSRTELMQAFATKASQDLGTPKQVSGSVDPDSSRPVVTPDDSRTDPSREELLNSLTLDEIEKIPALRSRLQSRVDSQVAGQLRNKEKELRDKISTEVALSTWKSRFEALDSDELGDLLKGSPEARVAFSQIQTAPPPPTPQEEVAASTFEWYRSVIRTVMDRAKDAKLDEDFLKAHEPQTYFEAHKDTQLAPNDLLLQWQTAIDNKIVETKVAAAGRPTVDDQSKKLDQRADSLNTRGGADLSGTGFRAAPTEDFMTVRSDLGLANAFARRAAK